MISELVKDSHLIQETFLVRKKEVKQTKTGKDYLALMLCDSSGVISAKVWDSSGVPDFAEGDVICVDGDVSEYADELQLIVTSRTIRVVTDANKLDYCRKTKYKVDGMWHAACTLLDSVENEWCQKLLHVFLDDEEFVQSFTGSSAAVSIHHDFVGGLLEHSLFIMRMCNQVCGVYKDLNRDLLLTSAFLHDIGKLKELKAFPDNTYTVFGNLIGHVTGSALMVDRACENIPDFPDDVRMKVLHCLLAHHGKLEWGSPKLPVIPEAFVLSTLDNMDAKLKVFEEASTKEDFSTYNKVLSVYPAKGEFYV